ncbi:MAG: hypothetical protein K2P13_10375, partial [Lachnospiraceae bacterium]|nr:hypothetical protein [Lachnospiraceae bacterium]
EDPPCRCLTVKSSRPHIRSGCRAGEEKEETGEKKKAKYEIVGFPDPCERSGEWKRIPYVYASAVSYRSPFKFVFPTI